MRKNDVKFRMLIANRAIWKNLLLVCILTSLLGCSAYYNTLYNGNLAFTEARKLHEKKARDFPDSLLVAAPPEATTKYERAIEKSTKVVEGFSKKKKWQDDALILMGKSYYYKKDFQKAIRRFQELQMNFPLSPFIAESFIYSGMCYIEEENYDKAENVLNTVLEKYPNPDKNQQITLLLVEIAIRREGRAEAIGLLEKSLKTAKTEAKRTDIVFRISQLYIDMKQYQKAIPLLLAAPRKKDYPEQAYKLDMGLLTCYTETEKLSDALQLISTMSSSRLYQLHMDEILYRKAMLLKQLGKIDDAIDVLMKICKKNTDTTSTVQTDTSSFVGKAQYALGLIYQQRKGSFKKAIEFFTLASKGHDTSVTIVASKKLVALQRLDNLRNDKDATHKKDSLQILISELFKFELDEPDSAYNEYLKLSRDTTARNTYIPKALSEAAIILRDDMKDTVRSDSLFKRVISDYPSTDYAKLAQKHLNIELTVVTREDSAAALYRSAEEALYINNDVKGAILLFYDIYKKYPELEITPKALYAAAWFSDNVLQKKSTGKSLYEKIRDKYPTSIYWTNEAKPRISALIDTLQALESLRKKNEMQQNRKNQVITSTDSLAIDKGILSDRDSLRKDDLREKVSDGDSLTKGKTEKPINEQLQNRHPPNPVNKPDSLDQTVIPQRNGKPITN